MEDWDCKPEDVTEKKGFDYKFGIIFGLIVLAGILMCFHFIENSYSKDRFESMGSKEEFCVYKTRLMVGVVFLLNKDIAFENIPIYWHGDETQNERDIVISITQEGNRVWMAKKKLNPGKFIDPIAFGDEQYLACMAGKNT